MGVIIGWHGGRKLKEFQPCKVSRIGSGTSENYTNVMSLFKMECTSHKYLNYAGCVQVDVTAQSARLPTLKLKHQGTYLKARVTWLKQAEKECKFYKDHDEIIFHCFGGVITLKIYIKIERQVGWSRLKIKLLVYRRGEK